MKAKPFDIKINLTKITIMLFITKALLDSQHPNLISIPKFADALCVGVGLAVFLLKVLSQRFTIKSFLAFAVSGLGILFTCYRIGQYNLLFSFITIYLLKDEDLDEYIAFMLKFQIIAIVIVFCIMSIVYFGYFEYIYWYRTATRVSFMACMAHPNSFAAYILSCMLMYGWLNFDKMTTIKFLMLILVSVISFLLTDTRTTLILSLLFILLLLLGRDRHIVKWTKDYLKYLFPCFSIFMLYAMNNYTNGNALLSQINDLLSGRIKLAAYAYHRSGITPLPRALEYVQSGVVQWQPEWGLNNFTFDNIYSFCWVQAGFVWLVIISVVIYFLIKNTDYKCHCFILVWIVYGFTEVSGLNCYRFFPILLVTYLLKDRKKKEEG